ncbi:uncharacterized protein LOC122398841 [Colletes gigas]|uniref:uncharacterized protein LOC122398841 n=1 Tax=Colletes gigas TaxID=935657 RepID=UPI001C9A3E44|nr:uncharacterized protein LOC122398841 [Colletes gigas]
MGKRVHAFCISVYAGPMSGQHARGSCDRLSRKNTGFPGVLTTISRKTHRVTMPLTRTRSSVRVLSTILAYFSNLSSPSQGAWYPATMVTRYVLLIVVYYTAICLSLPASYDQRQTGDLNVQIHLKDVQVLALMDTELLDDYTEYDYFYDYADFTVKPTVKPTTSSTASESTTQVSSSVTEEADPSGTSESVQNSTIADENNEFLIGNSTVDDAIVPPSADAEKSNDTAAVSLTEKPEDSINENVTVKARVNDKTRNTFEDDEDPAEQNPGGSSTDNPTKKLTKRRCKSGYSPDGKGRCRRSSHRRLSFIPLAMRLAPKLLDDLARNAKNLAQEEVHWMHSY